MKSLEDMNLLIIDDSEIIRQSTRAIFMNIGLKPSNIVMASSASRAYLECMKSKFDLFIVDFNLGEGSTGLQLLEKLYRTQLITNDSIILVVTANNSSPVIHGFLGFDLSGILVKPLKPEVLKKTLYACIEEKSSINQTIEIYQHKGLPHALQSLKLVKTKKSYDLTITKLCAHIWSLGQPNVAKKLLEGYLKSNQSTTAVKLYSEVSLAQGEIEDAGKYLHSTNNNSLAAFGQLDIEARCLLLNKEYDKAADLLEQLYEKSPYQLLYAYAYILLLINGLVDKSRLKKALDTWLKWSKGSVWDSADNKLCIAWAILKIKDNVSHEEAKDVWQTLMKGRSVGKAEYEYVKLLDSLMSNDEKPLDYQMIENLDLNSSFEVHLVKYYLSQKHNKSDWTRFLSRILKLDIEKEVSPLLRTVKQVILDHIDNSVNSLVLKVSRIENN
ncbi:response regulator [Vibrio kasasachensis]|uniref:response regulator n=1 Tax=Vibrio kasasachensis TaxID=2910248 RepID=UPI003D12A8D0